MKIILEENFFEGKEILLVDDEKDLREIIASEFEFLGGKIYQAQNIPRASEIFQEKKLDLIISDIRMPGGSGLELLHLIRKTNLSLPVILMTGFADIKLENAFNAGADVLIGKPFKLDDLIKLAQKCMKSLEEKYSSPSSEELNLKNLKKAECLQIGRGGMSLRLSGSEPLVAVKDFVKFSLQFSSVSLIGCGQCLWIKTDSQDDKGFILGVEFNYLTQDSVQQLKAFLQETRPSSYIPSFP